MFSTLSKKEILVQLLPSFCISMILAENFFRFGSFSLECGAFLASWYAFSELIAKLQP